MAHYANATQLRSLLIKSLHDWWIGHPVAVVMSQSAIRFMVRQPVRQVRCLVSSPGMVPEPAAPASAASA